MLTRNRKRRGEGPEQPPPSKRSKAGSEENSAPVHSYTTPTENTQEARQDGMALRSRQSNPVNKRLEDAVSYSQTEDVARQKNKPVNRNSTARFSSRGSQEIQLPPQVHNPSAARERIHDVALEEDEAAACLMDLADFVLQNASLAPSNAKTQPKASPKLEPKRNDEKQLRESVEPTETIEKVSSTAELVPPSFRNTSGTAIEADIFFNNKWRNYKRCAAHVSVAYYIYYDKRCQMLQNASKSDSTGKQVNFPLNLDPTYESRYQLFKSRLLEMESNEQPKDIKTTNNTKLEKGISTVGQSKLTTERTIGSNKSPPYASSITPKTNVIKSTLKSNSPTNTSIQYGSVTIPPVPALFQTSPPNLLPLVPPSIINTKIPHYQSPIPSLTPHPQLPVTGYIPIHQNLQIQHHQHISVHLPPQVTQPPTINNNKIPSPKLQVPTQSLQGLSNTLHAEDKSPSQGDSHAQLQLQQDQNKFAQENSVKLISRDIITADSSTGDIISANVV